LADNGKERWILPKVYIHKYINWNR
jgi:hypothetical protein